MDNSGGHDTNSSNYEQKTLREEFNIQIIWKVLNSH